MCFKKPLRIKNPLQVSCKHFNTLLYTEQEFQKSTLWVKTSWNLRKTLWVLGSALSIFPQQTAKFTSAEKVCEGLANESKKKLYEFPWFTHIRLEACVRQVGLKKSSSRARLLHSSRTNDTQVVFRKTSALSLCESLPLCSNLYEAFRQDPERDGVQITIFYVVCYTHHFLIQTLSSNSNNI